MVGLPRVRSPNRDKAFQVFKEHDGKIKNRRIAEMLSISEKSISGWKHKDRWLDKLNGVLQSPKRSTPRNKGGQPDNKNAVGNGAPLSNKNAEKHGFFSKWLPEETLDIVNEIEKKSPLDILWENIQIAYAAIVRAQKIMHVRNIEDKTVEVTGENPEIQQAWDKQANFLKAQARAQSELRSLIKQYDEMLHKDWDMATEEQKARIAVLKAKTNTDEGVTEDDGFIKAISEKVGDIWEE